MAVASIHHASRLLSVALLFLLLNDVSGFFFAFPSSSSSSSLLLLYQHQHQFQYQKKRVEKGSLFAVEIQEDTAPSVLEAAEAEAPPTTTSTTSTATSTATTTVSSFLIMGDSTDPHDDTTNVHVDANADANANASADANASAATDDEETKNNLVAQSDGGNDDDNDDDDDDDDDTKHSEALIRRKAMAKLLLSGTGTRRSGSKTPKEKTTATSVGARRIGSASITRSGVPKQSQLLAGIRRAANAASKSVDPNLNSTKISQLAIDHSIDSFLNKRTAGVDYSQQARAMGLLGAVDEATLAISHPLLRKPQPGTLLVRPEEGPLQQKQQQQQQKQQQQKQQQQKQQQQPPTPNIRISIRCATHMDDTDIAHLRLSVFSDFSPELRQQFCSRSRQVLSNRRLRGATCLVATTAVPTTAAAASSRQHHQQPQQPQPDVVLGSMECSVHEFYGTILGQQRKQNSVLYITEVAVNPLYRRCGVGTQLMKGVMELATKYRGIESLYLHVDVTNEGALQLYQEKMGFTLVNHQTDPMYNQFTTSLNLHDGATRGRNHYLLCKHLRKPTWLEASSPPHIKAPDVLVDPTSCARGANRPEGPRPVDAPSFGFDITA